MTKIKSLTELGEIYANNVDRTSITESRRDQNEILLTDAKAYLPTGSAPKTGEGFGKKQEELAKKTGPEEAEGFEKVDKKQDPGSDKAEMAAKQTTPKEKIQEEVETAPKSTKYKKPTFTMSKSKFDQLYEDAIKGVPFVTEEEETAPITPAGDDAAPEAPMGGGEEMGEESTLTHDEAIEMVEKLLAFLKKDVAHDIETGTLGDEEGAAPMGEEAEDEPMEEAVDAEDRGHANVGAGVKTEMGKDKNKIQTVGTGVVTQKGGTATEQGANFKNEPTPKKEKDSAHLKDGHKLHTVGAGKVVKTGSDAFAN